MPKPGNTIIRPINDDPSQMVSPCFGKKRYIIVNMVYYHWKATSIGLNRTNSIPCNVIAFDAIFDGFDLM